MDRFLNDMKKKVQQYAENGITIPINETMLLKLLQIKKVEQVEVTHASIMDQMIRIDGTFTKMRVPVKYSIYLEPAHTEDRTIYFRLRRTAPLDASWIHKKLFNRPPYFSIEGDLIGFHMEVIKQMQYIPVGKIDTFYTENKKIQVVLKA
ncbi:hypothetical protein [Sinobaca sp. H24]|uniref:hypothetical protein n=1 Tax=Sinobaca sp. H24 TaxID=2923376 RepID=UPI0020795EDD|nr:hypothetical protein [Sinobaca sp. H24]